MQNHTQTRRAASMSKRGRTLKRLTVATVALVVVAGAAVGVTALTNGSSTGQAQQTLDTYVVAVSSFDVTTTSSGELTAKNQIEVRSELENSSTIVEVIEEGKVAKKGQVLVRLNSDQVQTLITDVELRVETSRSELDKAETAVKIQEKTNASNLSQARLKVLLAELAYKQWEEGEKVQKTNDHTQAIMKAQEEKVRLEEKYIKCIELQGKGFVSTDQMKRDKLEFDDAVRALAKATLAKDIFEKYEIPSGVATKQSDVDQAKEALERVEEQSKIELKSAESERVTAQRKLDTNTEHLAKLRRQLERSTIIAPADGLVVYATSMEQMRRGWGDDGPLTIGRQVHPNESLIILPDTSVMVATVRVHETLASRIRVGLPATVKVDAVGGRVFNASVLSVGILAESSGWRDPNLREYTVKLAIDNVEGVEMKPSMRCEAVIIMGKVEDALSIPIQAVHNDGMLRFVHVQAEGGKFVRRPVKLGRISESLAEVAAGIQAGERVLLRHPGAGEVLDRQFTEPELAAVGLKRAADSTDLVRIDGGGDGPGAPGGGPARGNRANRGGGKPDGGAKPDVAAKPDGEKGKRSEDAPKPEAPKPEASTGTTTDKVTTGSEKAPAAATPPAAPAVATPAPTTKQ